MKKTISIIIFVAMLAIPLFKVYAQEGDGKNNGDSASQNRQELSDNTSQPATSTGSNEDQNFSDTFGKFQQDRQNFLDAQSQFNSDDNKSKESVRSKYVEQSQKVLASTVNVIMQRNRQLKGEIDSNQGYYGNIGNEISGKLDEDNQKLGSYISEINSASSTDSLSQAASEIKTFRTQQQNYLRKLIISAHIGKYEDTVIKTAQNRSQIIQNEINLVKNQGKDVVSLEYMLSNANNFISQSVDNINSAREVLNQPAIDADGLTSIQNYLDAAEEAIKNAYQVFRQIAIDGNILFSENSGDETGQQPASTSAATSTQ